MKKKILEFINRKEGKIAICILLGLIAFRIGYAIGKDLAMQ